jgi:hypothetical protein
MLSQYSAQVLNHLPRLVNLQDNPSTGKVAILPQEYAIVRLAW